MDLSEYRRDLARFYSELELARFEIRTQNASTNEIDRVYDRGGNIFDAGKVSDLIELVRSTESQTETESASRRRLCGAAVAGSVAAATRPLVREREQCRSVTRLERQRQPLRIGGVPELLANDPDRASRSELYYRWRRALKNCAEPSLELVDARRAGFRRNGYESFAEFSLELNQVDLDQWARAAEGFLQQTESVYFQGLAKLRARNSDLSGPTEWEYSDYLRWQRMAGFDRLFPVAEVLAAARTALSWMGIEIDRQSNLWLVVDQEPNAPSDPELFCVRPPEDVRIALSPRVGAPAYRSLFATMGRAQQAAWISHDMFDRHPEFIYGVDRATSLGFGCLMSNLYLDRQWVAALHTAGHESAATEVTAAFALLELHEQRESCVKLIFGQKLDAGEVSADDPEYAEIIKGATGFARGVSFADEAVEELDPAANLRAAAFEALLVDHLRSGYGTRWWSTRKAADELRDLWNTGSRYSVEQLTSMLGLGELSFDPLAERLTRAIRQN